MVTHGGGAPDPTTRRTMGRVSQTALHAMTQMTYYAFGAIPRGDFVSPGWGAPPH